MIPDNDNAVGRQQVVATPKLVRLLSNGRYSDYGILALALVECENDTAFIRDCYRRWVEMHPEQAKEYGFKVSAFVDWLLTLPEVSKVDFVEWHLGGYGRFEPSVDGPMFSVEMPLREPQEGA
jgi:hypothetical protein